MNYQELTNLIFNNTMYLYLLAFLLGCIAAFAELLSRYSRVAQIFKFLSSWIYFLINGLASILSYWLISEFNVDFGVLSDSEIGKIIVAGTSAMLILRSSFASIKSGNQNIEAGFASITNVFLKSADRTFDRKRSIDDYNEIEKIMKNVDFDKAKIDLPLICLGIMKNVSSDESQILGDAIAKLSHGDGSKKAKSINLGVLVSNIAGVELLEKVVSSNTEIFSFDEIVKENPSLIRISEILEKLK